MAEDCIDALLETFHDDLIAENLLLFDMNFPPLDIIDLQLSKTVSNTQSRKGVHEANAPLSEPNVSGFFSQLNDFQGGGNQFRGETSGANQIPNETGSYTGFGHPMEIIPYSCTFCQILREITHTNGNHFTKLEIHGRLGIISHVILESRYSGPASVSPKYQMFDFCKKSIEAVRQMLVQYCEDRKQAGYTMLQEPLHTYYESLCVGMKFRDNDDFLNDFEDLCETSPIRSSSPVADDFQIVQPQNQVEPEIDVRHPPKSSLAAQRKRTAKLTLRDFAWCNSFPINKAAKCMNVSPTFLKKICRRYGLERWPFRQIKGLQGRISSKRKSLTACAEERKTGVEAEIQELEQQLASVLAVFNHP